LAKELLINNNKKVGNILSEKGQFAYEAICLELDIYFLG
jgi:hypothetical protein